MFDAPSVSLPLSQALTKAGFPLGRVGQSFMVTLQDASTLEKIKDVIMNSGYYPIFREEPMGYDLTFVVCPYKRPDEFLFCNATLTSFYQDNLSLASTSSHSLPPFRRTCATASQLWIWPLCGQNSPQARCSSQWSARKSRPFHSASSQRASGSN